MRLGGPFAIAPALAALTAAAWAGTARAEEAAVAQADAGFALTYNAYVVSDYRGRGVSYSGNEPALQGGADFVAGGWSGGVWASTFPDEVDADLEVDLYGARSFEIGAAAVAVGAGYYAFPGADNWDFWEAEASVSAPIGPVDASLAVDYAWEQENLENEDDLYISVEAATPLGRFLGAPLTLSASAGWEEGFFALGDTKTDWSVGLAADIRGVEIAVSYVDTSLDTDSGEGGWVFSIGRTFG